MVDVRISRVPELERVKCRGCRGAGRCAGCGGKGSRKRGLISRSTETCAECSGNGKCGECSGTGQIPWPDVEWIGDKERNGRCAALHASLKQLHLTMGMSDARLLSWDSFGRVAKRRTFPFDDRDWLSKTDRETLAYREYLLFEEIRGDFYVKFRDELVEAGEHVHLEDIVRDASLGKLPVEFLTAVESKLQELKGTGELVSVLLFKPDDLKVDGKPLVPVVPEQGEAELVAAIVDKSTMKRHLVRAPARGFDL